MEKPKPKITDIPAHPGSFYLLESNLQSGVVYRRKAAINNSNFYHKFCITNAMGYGRTFVLKTILTHILPEELVPIGYHEDGNQANFFAKNCGPAILKLVKDNLTIANPKDPLHPFRLQIIIQFTTLTQLQPFTRDINKNLYQLLNTKVAAARTALDLSNFDNCADLDEYTPLFVPKIMYHILNISKSQFALKHVDLSNNALKNLDPLEVFAGTSLMSLNLENNQIETLAELQPLKQLELKELFLDGNPICNVYDEANYKHHIQEICPKLEILDGVAIGAAGVLVSKRNFLCNLDGAALVEQFIERYFTVYDCANRQLLHGLYHDKALFSLTAAYIPNQLSSFDAQIKDYKLYARNILSLVDYSRCDECLFKGSSNIMKLLARLPCTEHDPYTFATDLIHYSAKCAVLVVSGVFREPAKSLLETERMYGFTRNFVLECINGEYCIINEQLHVHNVLTVQQTRAFRHSKPVRSNVIPVPTTLKKKQQLIDAMKLITTVNQDWAKKCLEESNYDLQKALSLFVDLYKIDKIPADAFVSKDLFRNENSESSNTITSRVTEKSMPVRQKRPAPSATNKMLVDTSVNSNPPPMQGSTMLPVTNTPVQKPAMTPAEKFAQLDELDEIRKKARKQKRANVKRIISSLPLVYNSEADIADAVQRLPECNSWPPPLAAAITRIYLTGQQFKRRCRLTLKNSCGEVVSFNVPRRFKPK